MLISSKKKVRLTILALNCLKNRLSTGIFFLVIGRRNNFDKNKYARNGTTFIKENLRFRISFSQKLLAKIDENYDNFCGNGKKITSFGDFLRKCES
jgi:hypothetical protein